MAAPEPRLKSSELATLLARFGCPADRAPAMAVQLERRAQQLSEQTGRSYSEAMQHLIQLMSRGWAAQTRNDPI